MVAARTITRKAFVSGLAGLLAAGTLAACGAGGSAQQEGDTKANGAKGDDAKTAKTADATGDPEQSIEGTKLVVTALASPCVEILEQFAAPALAESGLTLEVKKGTNPAQANADVGSGKADANYCQNIFELEEYDDKNGADLVGVGTIHYEPFGVYSSKHDSLRSLGEGATIAVPNDPVGRGRALLLLQREGIVVLNDPSFLEATPQDLAENPFDVKFQELEAAAVPRALNDVDFAVVGVSDAAAEDLHASDAVALEANDAMAAELYGIVIATSPEKQSDPRVTALVELLQTEAFARFLQGAYNQDVLPLKTADPSKEKKAEATKK